MTTAWKDAQGKDVSIYDCIKACRLGVSVINKELQFNKKVKQNKKIAMDYERKSHILHLIQESYEQAGYKQQKKKEPRLITPSRKGKSK